MGLDMYLDKRIYIGGQYDWNKVEGIVDIRADKKQIPIDLHKVSYIAERVAYWRKANAIHNWFVENIQNGEDNCKEYSVSLDKLKELLELCRKVKRIAKIGNGLVKTSMTLKNGEWVQNYAKGKVIINADEVANILPIKEGFFFGYTDYNEYYLEDIDYTIKTLENIIKEDENGCMNDYVYSSSW